MKINVLFKKIYMRLELFLAKRSESNYANYLRRKGIKVGKNLRIVDVHSISIDRTRPSLVSIGDNVSFNRNFTLLTHDFVSGIFRNKYYDFINSSGKVVIGNNVRFGINVTVLKGVKIGDNSFIAAGSLVNKDIPSNSVAGGVPAKVICSMDDFYNKRKEICLIEAKEYAQSIVERFNRNPVPSDFWEEFHLFVNRSNIEQYMEDIPIKKQLGIAFDTWLENHESKYKNFEEFLSDALQK